MVVTERYILKEREKLNECGQDNTKKCLSSVVSLCFCQWEKTNVRIPLWLETV